MNESEFNERLKNVGRNDICPCGSGRKYKKCHLLKDEVRRTKELAKEKAELEKAAASESDVQEEENSKDVKQKKEKSYDHPRKKPLPKHGRGKGSNTANIPRRSAV